MSTYLISTFVWQHTFQIQASPWNAQKWMLGHGNSPTFVLPTLQFNNIWCVHYLILSDHLALVCHSPIAEFMFAHMYHVLRFLTFILFVILMIQTKHSIHCHMYIINTWSKGSWNLLMDQPTNIHFYIYLCVGVCICRGHWKAESSGHQGAHAIRVGGGKLQKSWLDCVMKRLPVQILLWWFAHVPSTKVTELIGL